MAQNRWLGLFLGLLLLLLAHGIALLYRVQPAVSLWFPPSGVAIALTLWFGPLGAGLAGIASFLVSPLWGNDGWSRFASLTDVVEPLVAWFLYRHSFKGSLALKSLRDAAAFLVSAPLVACGTSAVLGSLTLVAIGKMAAASLLTSIAHWWLGNAIGTLAIAPVALLLLTPYLQRWNWLQPPFEEAQPPTYAVLRHHGLEIACILASVVLVAVLTVKATMFSIFTTLQLSLISSVPAFWAVARFGVRGGVLTASFTIFVTLLEYLLLYPNAIALPQFPVNPELLYTHKLSLLFQSAIVLLAGTAITERATAQIALVVEQVRRAESEARAQLSEQLFQLNRLLTDANQQLQKSEERFRTSVENMLDCFGMYSALRDEQGQITDFRVDYINEAACLNNRMTRKEQVGQRLCELFPSHRDSGLFDDYCQVVETGTPLIKDELVYDDSFGLRRLTGAFDIRVAKWGDGFVATWRNVTDRKQLEVERAAVFQREQAARQQAEAASRMKDEFLAVVSHELRSPLNGILGWSRLLRTHKLDADTTEKALASIERNAQAQTQLIEDLLDISRIIRGTVRLNLRPISLIPVIHAALDTVRPAASTKLIHLECKLDPLVGSVSGDPERLQQIVWNLLSNAVKFTPDGGRVEVRLDSIGSRVRIQVMDTGKGISLEFLPHVFERFRQADATTTRNQGGLGLGLAIVRNLVELHGGLVYAESTGEGQGATFVVELPLLPETQQPYENGSILNVPAALDALQGLRVLVVDDDTDTRDFLVTALEQFGAVAIAATSTQEALTLFQQHRPDIVLSDIGMPDENGYDLIRKIRAMPPDAGGATPAAAITAYVRGDDRLLALTAGFQMHVAKPIDPSQLLHVVAQLAGRSPIKP